jgi:Domain of unknown function (DUF4177)
VSDEQWEYRVVRLSPRANEDHVEAILNEMGAAGWELVGITQTVTHWKSGPRVGAGLSLTGFADQTSETLVHRAYFKHRKAGGEGGILGGKQHD